MCPKYLLRGSVVLLGIFVSIFSYSQKTSQQKDVIKQKVLQDKKVKEVFLSPERETPSAILFDLDKPAYREVESGLLLRNYLSLRPGYDNLEIARETRATKEIKIKDFQQYFKGIPVAYSHYKSLAKGDDLFMLSGSFYQVPSSISVTPAINEATALNIAKKHVGAKKYAWEEVQDIIMYATNENVKKILQKELEDYLPKGELVIVKDFTNEVFADMRLAYKFNLYAAEPISRGYIYIDAITGKVLLYDAIIKHASVPTTVKTRYSGDRVILTSVISGTDPGNGQLLVSSHPQTEPTYTSGSPTYSLRDDTRGKTTLETFDLNNAGGLPLSVGALYAQAKSFTDVDNNWTLLEHKRGMAEGGTAEAENDDIAWDAHWGAETVYDYWLAKHKRRSYDDKNAGIKSYVHYGPAYDNAFWNGTAMTYGDGSGQQAGGFKALTSLDVCGHEIGHGVCSNTSDLVYANESGGMNEGFSDIWAACVENFVIKSVDPSLASVYKPFFIGEQISYTAEPLRRMDNPKAVADPDTRFGRYYKNPNCTPTLANDQCGVHTNSNVLNKWFYLLTCGSGVGSGPDIGYVIPGADDGKKDTVIGTPFASGARIVQDTIPYSVTGLGFEVSEQLAYLTEIMLSSTANYDEAREMSIATAKAFSGDPCGQIVQSVTNAWFAVGVGSAFVAPCTVTYGFVSQMRDVSEGANGVGCTGIDSIAIPILLPANSTASVILSGTATMNVDYLTPSQTFVNNTSGTKVDTINIYIIDDGVIEPEESVIINLAVGNLGGNTANSVYTINIFDDDVIPVIGKDSVRLLTENFETVPIGYHLPQGWVETLEIPEVPGVDPTTAGKNHWGVFQPGQPNSSKTLAIAARVISLTGDTTAAPNASYSNTSPSQTRAVTPLIDARGLSNIKLAFDYTVQGEVDANGADFESFGKFDYMELAYSFDGVNFRPMGDGFRFASLNPSTGKFNNVLPAFLNNRRFYLAFRWINDTNAGGPFSVSIDNVTIDGSPKSIETAGGRAGTQRINGSQEVYFYSNPEGNVIAKLNTTGAEDLGCVTASVVNAGTGTRTLYTGTDNSQNVVGNRIVRVTPSSGGLSPYSITLYFTQEEIQAIQNATNTPPSGFYLYKVTGDFASSSNANTIRVLANYTALPNNAGGMFTGSYEGGFSDFALGAPVTAALPVTCLDFKAVSSGNTVTLNWRVSSETNNKQFEIERSFDGTRYSTLTSVNANSRNGGAYNYTDNNVAGKDVYYRLKQIDATGEAHYTCSVVKVRLNGQKFLISPVYPNPGKDNSFVKITASEGLKIRIELLSSNGQLVQDNTVTLAEGSNIIPLKLTALSAGNYMIRFRTVKGDVLSSQSFIKK